MPERGARMPTRNGLFCAMAGPKTRPDVDKAPMAAADASSLRRDIAMIFLPGGPRGAVGLSFVTSNACQQQARRIPVAALGRAAGAKEIVDLRAGQRPVVIEVRDDGLHERLREPDSALPVAQVV